MGDAALASPPEEQVVDVVVVGGGPTGLFLALLARKAGLSVTVLDSKPGPLEFGRADALNPRTQQYLEVAGVLDELLAQGIKCNTTSTYANGRWLSRRDRWFTGLEHCHHKTQLMLGQPALERALARHALAHGADLRYGETAVAIPAPPPPPPAAAAPTPSPSSPSSPGAATVAVVTARGETVRGRCLVGADGARSLVRQAAGIAFRRGGGGGGGDDGDVGDVGGGEGEGAGAVGAVVGAQVWGVMDVFVETDFPQCDEIISFELGGRTRVQWIPRERGLARFYALLDDGSGEDGGGGDGEVTLERTMECVKEHLAPHWVEFKGVEWFSSVEVKERMASSFATELYEGGGRVFLIGDAAHVHSFRGGQGLNTGLADAFALAWRLEALLLLLDDESAARLVGSYEAERRAVAAGIIGLSGGLSRDAVRSSAEYLARVERNAGYITGMGVSYSHLGSELVRQSGTGAWTAGNRCPELDLRRPDATETERLYSLIQYGRWVVVTVEGPCGEVGSGQNVARVCFFTREEARKSEPGRLDPRKVLLSSVSDLATGNVVVVRPDLYIGYVGECQEAWQYIWGAV